MSTTAGSRAFIGSVASKNGAITQRLVDAGLIVLGKGNMTVCFIPRYYRYVRVFLGLIVLIGVCGHENDHDDAWLVCTRWSDALVVRGEDGRE